MTARTLPTTARDERGGILYCVTCGDAVDASQRRYGRDTCRDCWRYWISGVFAHTGRYTGNRHAAECDCRTCRARDAVRSLDAEMDANETRNSAHT